MANKLINDAAVTEYFFNKNLPRAPRFTVCVLPKIGKEEFELEPEEELFEGKYRTKMFRLVQAGFTPWSTENIMDARSGARCGHYLWDFPFDTGFGIAGTEKKVYLFPYSTRLLEITPKTKLTAGGLPFCLDDCVGNFKIYDRKDLLLRRHLSEEEVRNSPVWLDFAGGNQERLDKYVSKVFRYGFNGLGYKKMMGIWVPKDKNPIERAVMLEIIPYGSSADSIHLSNYARLVGVRK